MGKKLLLWIDNAALYRDALARAGIADQLDIEDVAMAAQASDAQLAATELMLTWTVPPGTLDRMPRLEWIQTPNTGVAAWLKRPDLRPGGWAFQYANPYYPDVDDTAVVATAMDRLTSGEMTKPYAERIERAREWIIGLQSKNGGWEIGRAHV